MALHDREDYTGLALGFVSALANRETEAAYERTSREFRSRMTIEAMREGFEAIVPPDFGPVTSIEAGLSMESWPDKLPSDVGWVYVTIGGDVFSEAATVIVVDEDGSLKVREVVFGRP